MIPLSIYTSTVASKVIVFGAKLKSSSTEATTGLLIQTAQLTLLLVFFGLPE
jgi:hypothetical protein